MDIQTKNIFKIHKCEYYKKTKSIMASHKKHKEIEVGEVLFIKSKVYDDSWKYVSRNRGGKDKFMVFYKDADGFIFIKRINAAGKLGVEVQCLTTQYPPPRYEIESDPDYIESIVFDDGKGYDPLAAEKLQTKKKGQARRKNKKLEINFNTNKEAYEHIKTYNVGDIIYDCATTYGSGIIAWKITNIIKRPTDKTKQTFPRYTMGATNEDQQHNKHGFSEVIQLNIVATNSSQDRRHSSKSRIIQYSNFCNSYYKYYKEKPYTIEDF